MLRHRQVRLSYPLAYVQLAVVLARRHGRYRTAKALGLPLSTIYRWLDECRSQPQADVATEPAALDDCIRICRAHGFDLRQRIALLEPSTAPARSAAGTETRSLSPAQPVPDANEAVRQCGVGASAFDPRTGAVVATMPATAVPPHVLARVQSVRAAIDARYYAPLSCEYLAGIAGMSRFHFIRMFRQAFGVSPYRYLLQARIRHARALLGTTAQPLDAVAAAVGFDSASLLCKAYKSIEGVSLASAFRGQRLGTQMPGASVAAG